jgi:hypothetical protein
MKTIIAGSRSIKAYKHVCDAVASSGFTITEAVSGCAAGIDLLGENWAKQNGIPIKRFPANWDVFGKQAGFIRNGAMVNYVAPDGALIAIWDGKSNGTNNVIMLAKRKKIQYYILFI